MDRSSGDGRLRSDPAHRVDDPVSRSRELDDVSFGAILESDERPAVQWSAPGGLEIAGRGATARFVAAGRDRFSRLRREATAFFDDLEYEGRDASRPRAFGGFAFHDGHEPTALWSGFEAGAFVVPRVQVARTDAGTWLTTVGDGADEATALLDRWQRRLSSLPAMRPSGSGPGVGTTRRTTSRAAWREQVALALERIDRGDLRKVVLAQALSAELTGAIDVPATLERLRRRYPNCHRFMIAPGADATFFGAPPERLVAKRGARVDTEALAGSVGRGDTPEEDEALVERLRDNDKFRREHGLVVEAIRDKLAPLSRSVTIGDRTVRRLATIQHLQTPVEAALDEGHHVLDVVEALHPTPAVGGLPPEAAWETIRGAETFDRGWYAAPIGWFDGDGDGEFAVGIRSGVAIDETVTLFAGNGIVADSDPDEEWDEVQLKFRPILDELG